jgi:hypothetical protein
MLVLMMIGSLTLLRLGGLQWHDIHIKCHGNPSNCWREKGAYMTPHSLQQSTHTVTTTQMKYVMIQETMRK